MVYVLAFMFALLVLYPDQQEILHSHVKSIIPDGQNPVCMHHYKLLPSVDRAFMTTDL